MVLKSLRAVFKSHNIIFYIFNFIQKKRRVLKSLIDYIYTKLSELGLANKPDNYDNFNFWFN